MSEIALREMSPYAATAPAFVRTPAESANGWAGRVDARAAFKQIAPFGGDCYGTDGVV